MRRQSSSECLTGLLRKLYLDAQNTGLTGHKVVVVGWQVSENITKIDGVAPLVTNPTDRTPLLHYTWQNLLNTE